MPALSSKESALNVSHAYYDSTIIAKSEVGVPNTGHSFLIVFPDPCIANCAGPNCAAIQVDFARSPGQLEMS